MNLTLNQQRYGELKRRSRGLARRYLDKMAALSRAQITRLTLLCLEGEAVQPSRIEDTALRNTTRGDIELLAAVDEAHQTRSGPTTGKILQRAY